MQNTPYNFFRYSIFEGSTFLSASEQWDLLIDNINREVAYRKTYPTELDKDTSIIMPDRTAVSNPKNNAPVDVFFFSIAKHINTRKANKYDKSSDQLSRKEVSTDEYIVGDLVMIPIASLIAASDRSEPEDLNASSSTNRFATIVRSIPNHQIVIESAASHGYLKSALANWQLEEFSFTVRPFNPSVKTPGDKMHKLLIEDNAKVFGKAKPNKGDRLKFSDDGIMSEVTGLADRGYGEYGAKGTTGSGYHARIEKSAPESRRPPQIKVYIPMKVSKEEHAKAVAITLLEINE